MAQLNPRPEAAALVRDATVLIATGANRYSCNALRRELRDHPECEHLMGLYRGLFLQHPWFCEPDNNLNYLSDDRAYPEEQRQGDRLLAMHMFANMLEKGTLP